MSLLKPYSDSTTTTNLSNSSLSTGAHSTTLMSAELFD